MHGALSIEQIIGMNFPKYNTLNIANRVFSGSQANNINIYLDAYQIIYSILSVPNISLNPVTSVVSSIINLCAHLRSYYRTAFSVESKIFIVYADGSFPLNTNLYMNYNSAFKTKCRNNPKIIELVNSNVMLLKELCKYLPDIYFIQRSVEPAVTIYDLINSEATKGNTNPNIIVSKDPHMCLLTSVIPNIDTVIFKLYKPIVANASNQEFIHVTTFINSILNYFNFTHTISNINVINNLQEIDPMKLSLLVALTSSKNRNIKNLKNTNVAVAIVKDFIKSGVLGINLPYDIEKVYNSLPNNVTTIISKEAFINRWKALDVPFQHMIYKTLPESYDESWYVNLSDATAVKNINNRYFIHNPIDLNRL